jgi:hypothetical protein
VTPVEITPEPDEPERKAILVVLADEDVGRPAGSAWAEAILPGHDDLEP